MEKIKEKEMYEDDMFDKLLEDLEEADKVTYLKKLFFEMANILDSNVEENDDDELIIENNILVNTCFIVARIVINGLEQNSYHKLTPTVVFDYIKKDKEKLLKLYEKNINLFTEEDDFTIEEYDQLGEICVDIASEIYQDIIDLKI
jgi:hypothetical protein